MKINQKMKKKRERPIKFKEGEILTEIPPCCRKCGSDKTFFHVLKTKDAKRHGQVSVKCRSCNAILIYSLNSASYSFKSSSFDKCMKLMKVNAENFGKRYSEVKY